MDVPLPGGHQGLQFQFPLDGEFVETGFPPGFGFGPLRREQSLVLESPQGRVEHPFLDDERIFRL